MSYKIMRGIMLFGWQLNFKKDGTYTFLIIQKKIQMDIIRRFSDA